MIKCPLCEHICDILTVNHIEKHMSYDEFIQKFPEMYINTSRALFEFERKLYGGIV